MEPVDYTCRLRYFEKKADKYGVKAQLKETCTVRLSQFEN